MISIHEALKIIAQNNAPLAVETISLTDSINRILAENVVADTDLPPFNRSQMDGYAIRAEDAHEEQATPARFKIVGEAAAGNAWTGELKTGEAVRIMTGAMVPDGANAVQKLEVAREFQTADGTVFVELSEAVKTGQNINPRASEIEQGTVLFAPGELITLPMIASLASFGCARVRVGKQPHVSILATGNELVPVDSTPGASQIRDSNSVTLRAYSEAAGATATTLENSEDDLENLKLQILNAIEISDLLILAGGVSVGKYDFTKLALSQLGAQIFIEKVALRPGKPFVFAKLNEKPIFGLPGNPVSVIVTFNLFVRAAILQMQGAREINLKTGFAVVTKNLTAARERDSFLPVKLSTDNQGRLLAEPLDWGGSSDFVAFARADALVFVPCGAALKTGNAAQIVFLD